MSLLDEVRSSITRPDEGVRAEVMRLLDAKTKPRRSLGRLEDLASDVAAIQGTPRPDVTRKAIVVMAGDHGVASEGVSAFPQEVTVQMVANFASGGAAISVLARQAGADVMIVDMGCRVSPPVHPRVFDRRIGPGTRSITQGPAMTREEAVRAIDSGIEIAGDLVESGVRLLGLGEMGIGNTTASAAMAAVFLGKDPEEMTGRGTGVGEEGYRLKVAAVARALSMNRPDPFDALDVLSKLGGFEIAGLVGVVLGGVARRVPVITDGVIATVAAVTAARLVPEIKESILASHRSVEKAHVGLLALLGAKPLFDLEMRLGEGTGAALAMHFVESAIRILDEMATFDSAGVEDSGA